ncbi:hypothetical protein [Rhodopirellula sallentina]|uniref:hypothetical protein n=1 Tax=Rhodopirellula sallentina TaxID=1263869 RepID=UPI001F3943AE|nr:hypothetical protein [Rhodopirellula sallentina]
MADAAEGTLTFLAVDEATGEPVSARIELTRPQMIRANGRLASRAVKRPLAGRTSVDTGYGFVVDGEAKVNLHEGPYEFRVTRGPESRVIAGNFEIEKTSEDETTLIVPRILSMREQGWTSGDCLVPPSKENLPIRMSAEDLHVAIVNAARDNTARDNTARENDSRSSSHIVTEEELEQLRARRNRKELPKLTEPMFIDSSADAVAGLVFYHDLPQPSASDSKESNDLTLAAFYRLANLAKRRRGEEPTDAPEILRAPENHAAAAEPKVAIEDPFAWSMPVMLASGQIDGFFVLGDWLRLDRKLLQTKNGRPFSTATPRPAILLGREAEQIYWETLDAGFRMAPLAGSGDGGGLHPVGYNRLYVAGPYAAESTYENVRSIPSPVTSREQWWDNAWAGHSFATNGPLLQATLGGKLPGHVFEGATGVPMRVTPELTLTVRDPVDYLEVIHNGKIHYSAKLDEYAKAGGKIPPINVDEPGWALIRVVTLFEDHFRAATTAPWYFDIEGERRISRGSVEFFQTWLGDYEQHLRSQRNVNLARYAPFIRAARTYWKAKLEKANAR